MSVAVDGTFYFDFTDLLPANAGAARYYLGMYDGTAGNAATLKDFRLLDPGKGIEVPCRQAPRTADGSQAYAYVDYDVVTGTVPSGVQDSSTVKAPSHLAATVSSDKVVRLSWVNNAWNATGFHVERASKTGIGAGNFTRITEQPVTATEYSDSVGPGIFSYRVQAVNTGTGSASSYSNRTGARVK
jgi:hypothetical protein